MTDDITGDLDLLGDWLDAKGYTEEAGLCLRVLGLIHERDEEIEKLRSGNNEAYVFGLHKGKEAAFIDYDIDGLRAEIKVLRAELEKTKRFYIEAGLELRQLREDNKRLRDALKPFAKQYDPNKTYLVGGFYTLTVKFEDIRAAAAALKEIGDE